MSGEKIDSRREASVSSLLLSFKKYVAESNKGQILSLLIDKVPGALETSLDNTYSRSFIFPDSTICQKLSNLTNS